MPQSDSPATPVQAGLDSVAPLLRMAASCVIAATLVGTLYLARPVLLPFALAILVAFVLAPLVSLLGRWGMRRGTAVVCTVAFSVAIFASLALFIGTQLSHLAPDVPRYQATLLARIETIRNSAARSNLIRNASGVFNKFDSAISGTPATPSPSSFGMARARRPVPVEIRQPNPGPLRIIEEIADPLVVPLARAVLVIIFVIFMLIQKEDLRDRFISLTGARDLQRTTRAIDDGAQRLSRYLLLQTTVNACFGIFIAAGLWLIGIPSPALWGLIAGIARFVPYVGVPAASLLPLTLALAAVPGWAALALTALLIFGTEAIVGQFVEPWLYGRNTGLSSIAIILCAVFWTWIWGPVGLLLSTPLTMCLAIMGRHVEYLKFLDILLGDRAPLLPEEAFYLSMLAGKPDEEAARAELFLKEAPLCDYFDRVATKGLVLARADELRGALDSPGGEKIRAAVGQLLEDLSEEAPRPDAVSVLCLAGRGELDRAAADLLCALLERGGIGARVIPAEMTSSARLAALDPSSTRIACLSYVAPCSWKNARYLVRRLRRQLPQAHIMAAFWGNEQTDTSYLDALEVTSSDAIVTTMAGATAQIAAVLKGNAHGARDAPLHALPDSVPRQRQGAEA